MKRKLLFFCLLPLLFISNSYAEESSCLESSCRSIEKCGVLPSARKCINCVCENRKSGLISNVDFLVFQTRADGFDFAFDNNVSTNGSNGSIVNLNGQNIDFNYKYKPGFKLALGFYIPRISWDFIVNWTYLYSKENYTIKRGLNDAGAGLIPTFGKLTVFNNGNNLVRYSSARPEYKIHFNSVDVEMGDSFQIKNFLSFRIFGGLKGAIIHQKFDTAYQDGNTFTNDNGDSISLISKTTRFRSSAKGLGPRIGIDSTWNLFSSNYNLLANSSCSFLLTRFNMTNHQIDSGYNNTTTEYLSDEYKMDEYIWVVRPQTQFILGLEWVGCFGCSKDYFLGIKAAYEVQYFFEQNLSRRLIDDQLEGISYPNKGDLLLHGFLIALRFEY